MLPMPTTRATSFFSACVVVLIFGVFLRSSVAIVIAGCGLVGLAAALSWAIPAGRRLRRERLEFAWWLMPSGGRGGALVPGATAEIRGYLRHPGRETLHVSDVRPIASEALLARSEPKRVLSIAPRARTEFTLQVVGRGAGRAVLHGLSLSLRTAFGLFEVPLYFPNPITIAILPRVIHEQGMRPTRALGRGERAGATTRTQRGGGMELYELRELQPGDPFNAIAWKPSARRGRLLVKEVASEMQESVLLVLDAGAGMRSGPPGRRLLDGAIDFLAREATAALRRGARVGLVTFDGRILESIPPRDGNRQLEILLEGMLASTEAYDEDRTEITEDELVARVGRYLRRQDGLELSFVDPRSRRPSWDVLALSRTLSRMTLRDGKASPVSASTPLSALLREFCRARALPLPPREAGAGDRSRALEEVVKKVLRSERSPMFVRVVTDLHERAELERLSAPFRVLRARGHVIEFVVPDAVSITPPPASRLETSLARIYGPIEARRRAEAERALRRMGIAVRTLREPLPHAPEWTVSAGQAA